MTLASCSIYKLFYNFPIFLSFDGLVGFGQEPFLVNNCSVTFFIDDICYCPTWYLFYGFHTVFPFDGLVLWIRTGAISDQQLQCEHLLHHQQQAGEIIRWVFSKQGKIFIYILVFVNKYSEQILSKSSIIDFRQSQIKLWCILPCSHGILFFQ